jgi:hypothetical protein
MEIREVAPAALKFDTLTAEAGAAAEEKALTPELASAQPEAPAADSGSQCGEVSATDRSASDDRQPDAPLHPPEEFPDVEARAVLHEIADLGLLWAADLAAATSAAGKARGVAEETDATATTSLTDYGQRAVELARQNANLTFHFAADLFAAKTFAEVVALSTAHARKQFEAFSDQGRVVAALARKAASRSVTSVKRIKRTKPTRKSVAKPARKSRSAA